MKNLFFCFVIILGLNSCKFKDATVGAADAVSGKYTIKNLKDAKNNFNFPYTAGGTTFSGAIDIIKIGSQQVDIKMSLDQKTGANTTSTYQNESKIGVSKSGSTYKLEKDGASLGTLKGSTLTLEFTANKETTTVTAEKN